MPRIPVAQILGGLAAALACASTPHATAQTTARDRVPAYDADYGQGINFGYYDPWTDKDLARLSSGTLDGRVQGIGVNAYRPGLFSHHLERWGYDNLVDEFEFYRQLGVTQNVVIAGYPSAEQQSREVWCSDGSRSNLFRGMWEPIWDDGADGTPYNEDNAYAEYLYRAVETYGDYVRFWEVSNEPDFNYADGWKPRGLEGNWFENDIDPCDIAINAPIQAYVRMLRISYEVIKRLQPDDFVAIGGIGSVGFLDAVLRTTDEKESGAVTPGHPYGGGAYFDAMSFHVYPHVDGAMREYSVELGDFVYSRHSDAAVDGVLDKQAQMEATLAEYGFDGERFPLKVPLCTETNLPRVDLGTETAEGSSVQMQRNFMIKSLALTQASGLAQLHPYQLADRTRERDADGEYDLMGFYEFIGDIPDRRPEAATATLTGIAYRTYGELLRGAEYSAELTDGLALPEGARGVGFTLPSGKAAFVLWAATQTDGNEFSYLDYAPAGKLAEADFQLAAPDYALTRRLYDVPAEGFALRGTPIFAIEAGGVDAAESEGGSSAVADGRTLGMEAFPNPAVERLTVTLPGGDPWHLSVFDAVGREVMDDRPRARGTATLEVATLPAGSYYVQARRGEVTATLPFVRG